MKQLIIVVIYIHFLSENLLHGQQKYIALEDYKTEIVCFDSIYGTNKKILPEFLEQTLIALSFYPELKDAHITFRYKLIGTSMACRPKLNFIFKRRANRQYVILINPDKQCLNDAILKQIPFNAQIGVIGHELGHVVDYSNKNALQIMFTGIGYIFKNYRIRLEAEIDCITIEHCLGWQLYDFCDYILNRSNAPEGYKAYKRQIYYVPQEIKEIIINMDIYKKDFPESQ